jgi:oxygen-independent coproporphyrinogen-3 oxidase
MAFTTSPKNNDDLFLNLTEKIAATDYSGHASQYPPLFTWKDDLSRKTILRSWRSLIKTKPQQLGLYVHFPYCKQRCSFCRYFSVKLLRPGDCENYLLNLNKEAKMYARSFSHYPFSTLYFGGGSPSLLKERQLDRLFEVIRSNFNLDQCQQIAFEGNPDFLSLKKLKVLKRCGVNRLTIGVQSSDSFKRCFASARKLSIQNINVDLMAGLPAQTRQSFLDTLTEVLILKPDMIHVHPFYPTSFCAFMKIEKRLSEKDVEKREQMVLISQKMLQCAGYRPMRFDTYGKREDARNIQLSDSIECNAPFLGLGPAAISHASGFLRYANAADIRTYKNSLDKNELPVLSSQRTTKKDEMIFFVLASLRYGHVDKTQFRRLFGQGLETVFKKEVKYLIERRLIKDSKDFLNTKMMNIGEYLVYSKYFYDPDMIRHLEQTMPRNKGPVLRKDLRFILL